MVNYNQLPLVMNASCVRVNLIVGNINNIKEIVQQLHEAGKKVFVHAEMINGLSKDKDAVRYLAENIHVDGVTATKSVIISAAKSHKIASVQRIFAIDSSALRTAVKTIKANAPDEVELMPGLMPEIITQVKALILTPLIVGGLIKSVRDIENALQSGADYVSTGDAKLW